MREVTGIEFDLLKYDKNEIRIINEHAAVLIDQL
jgi:hypothetical protein